MKKAKKISIAVLSVIAILVCLVIIDNNRIQTTHYEYSNEKIPREFDGFKIVQISDLHNKSFGKNQSRLIKKIKDCSPDIIVFTGDMVSRRAKKLQNAESFIRNAVKICDVYYVEGNHERYSYNYNVYFKPFLEGIGVHTLRNKSEKIFKNGKSITVSGLNDPVFTSEYGYDVSLRNEVFCEWIKNVTKRDNNEFQILLSHRPEYFEKYVQFNADLVLSGHTHGGQVILPFVGGVYAPNQGLFPKYDKGKFTLSSTTMIVCRGLGNSISFPRINDCPEIVCVTLKSK